MSSLEPFGFIIITTPRKEAQEQWLKYSIPNQPIEDWLSENEIASIMKSLHFQHHLLEKFSITPHKDAPSIEIYQLWLFQKL